MAQGDQAIQILLVEDNPGDVRLTQEALKTIDLAHELHVVRDGVEAIDYLRGSGRFAGATRPHLILLDLNLPRKNGREVLKEIKRDAALRRIPVVVLTTSTAEEDITRSYDLHANSYIAKPVNLDHFHHIVQTIGRYWFSIVSLAPE
jgi:chemotaxis family two-component system response regulator Rcp1